MDISPEKVPKDVLFIISENIEKKNMAAAVSSLLEMWQCENSKLADQNV